MGQELGITVSKEEDGSEWYQQVIEKSDLAEYSDVSGCMVYKPLACSIWDKIKRETDKRFKQIGIENTYFPLFIPESLLEKEAEHFAGFNPEVAWVTQTGSSKLEERLAVRPTSETIMYPKFKKWIRSWRDLPLKLNQWNNVVRWEFKHATPFLRSREFLWNEGHCAYASEEEALNDRDKVLDAYQTILEDYLALPGYRGKKTDKEKFAGAVASYSIEHMLPDGKAIQGPDYHYDGTNFAQAFDLSYTDQNEEKQRPVQTTFAITTREIGVMILMHGDDRGLVLPPKIAPTQVVIIPIYQEDNQEKVINSAKEIEEKLDNVKLDDRDYRTPGWKFNEWEVKGVPLRIELGPNEVEAGEVTLVRRDTGDKVTVSQEQVEKKVEEMLEEIQAHLYQTAEERMKTATREARDYTELKQIIEEGGGFVKAPWCGDQDCEDQVKEETKAKITNIPDKYGNPEGEKCVKCGKEAQHWVHFAKSY